MLKLNLGCGNRLLEGYINADLQLTPPARARGATPDNFRILDMTDLGLYSNGSVDEIRCHRAIRHLPEEKVIKALQEWARVLRPGGLLLVEVADIQVICQRILDSQDPEQRIKISRTMYGGLGEEGLPMRSAWWPERLETELKAAGFSMITRRPGEASYTFRMEAIK